MKKKSFYWGNLIIPIVLGVIVYILYRQDTYIAIGFTRLMETVGLKLNYPNVQNTPGYFFIRNYVCDGLWAYSLTFAVFLAYDCQSSEMKKTFIISAIFGICIELLQKLDFIPGTFDYWDIAVQTAFCLCAIGIISLKNRRRR